MKKLLCFICLILLAAIFMFAASSCNVTRQVTTKAEYYQNGDTTVQIVTRTIESYDGTVKPQNMFK